MGIHPRYPLQCLDYRPGLQVVLDIYGIRALGAVAVPGSAVQQVANAGQALAQAGRSGHQQIGGDR